MYSSWPEQMTQRLLNNKHIYQNLNNWSFGGGDECDDDAERLSEAWDTPSQQEMSRRQMLRQNIREETLLNRRIHRHGGIIGGRNIALILRQRELLGHGGNTIHHTHVHVRGYRQPVNLALDHLSSAGGAEDPRDLNVEPLPSLSSNMLTTIRHPSSSHRHKDADCPTATTRNKAPVTLSTPFSGSLTQEIRTFAEYSSVVRYHSAFLTHLGGQDDILVNGQRPASSPAVSTISVAFSPDAKTMASTHGDHSVKITACGSGHILETLVGHPRTPWTVKYHPSDPTIVASGCLGHQVRLWNWTTATCLHMIRLEHAIISLSFHPQGQVLAIANGSRLHFWSMEGLLEDDITTSTSSGDTVGMQPYAGSGGASEPFLSLPGNHQGTQQVSLPSSASQSQSQQQRQRQRRRGALTEIEQRHMLRCVHFPPDGKSVIVGGVNQQPMDRTLAQQRRPNQLSFYLRLFDFDVEAAKNPHELSQTTDAFGKRRKIINNVSRSMVGLHCRQCDQRLTTFFAKY